MKRHIAAVLAVSMMCGGSQSSAQTTREPEAGLSVVVEAARAEIKPGEAVVLRFAFKNSSSQAVRLPMPILPPPHERWSLTLQNAATGRSLTGISTKPMGAALDPDQIRPHLLQPDQSISVTAAFEEFAFLEGAMAFQEARNVWFPQRTTKAFPLPAGTYDVEVSVRLSPAATESIRTNKVRITVTPDAVVRDSDRLRIAKDVGSNFVGVVDELQADLASASLLRHAGLRNDLRVASDAAKALSTANLGDLGSNERIRSLRAAMDQVVSRASEISSRQNETQEDRREAIRPTARLRALAAPLATLPPGN